MVINIGSTDPAAIVPFWSAVLALDEVDGELNDRLGRQPVVCFQHLQEPRPGHGRIHVDVWVPHDQAQALAESALTPVALLLTRDLMWEEAS